MSVLLVVVASVYGTIGFLLGWAMAAVALDEGCPWYLAPTIFVGGVLTWPLILIDLFRENRLWRTWE
jgi:hypothetical protein